MATFTLEIDGLDDLIQNTSLAAAQINQQIGVAMSQSVNQIKNDAQNLAPYVTGQLRQSITADVQDSGLTGIVYQDPSIAPYGSYVEFGTGIYVGNSRWKGNIPGVGWRWINGQRPQPYLIPAFQNDIELVQGYFQEAIRQIFLIAAGQS